MTGHATFAAIRITRQNNSTAIAGRKIRLFFRVLNRDTSLKSMPKDFPQATQQTEHSQPSSYESASTTAPVTSRFSKASGSMYFQPQAINWSKRGLGKAARNKMNRQMNTRVLMPNHIAGGRTGPNHPPQYKSEMAAETRVTPMYSPTKNIPNFILEYSE